MRLYGAIQKVEPQDDGTVRVHGIATSEAIDEEGEIVRADAIRAAIPDYMRFPALREMHQLSAAGTTLEAEVCEDGTTRIVAHVVDPVAVSKVKNQVYRGFSIGGRVTQRESGNPKTITGIVLNEISLVDRPANPEAIFDCWKAAMASNAFFGVAEPDIANGRQTTVTQIPLEQEPFNAPIQIWACTVPEHRHLAKTDALRCLKGDGGTIKHERGRAVASAVIASDEEAVSGTELRKSTSEASKTDRDVRFADLGYQPDGKKRYQIDTDRYIRAAWSRINRPDNAKKYNAKQLRQVRDEIIAAWKEKIGVEGPPSAEDCDAASRASLTKALCDVGQIARVITELDWLRDVLEVEAALENDQSPQPARLLGIIMELCNFLNCLANEEIGEILDGAETDGLGLASAAPGLLWTEAAESDLERVAALLRSGGANMRRLAAGVLTKAKHSRADQALLNMAYFGCDQCLKIGRLSVDAQANMDRARYHLQEAGAMPTPVSIAEEAANTRSPSPARQEFSTGDSTDLDIMNVLGIVTELLCKRERAHENLMDLAHGCLEALTDGSVCGLTAKFGARHSNETLEHFRSSHRYLVAAGAKCDMTEIDEPSPTTKLASGTRIRAGDLATATSSELVEKAAVAKVLGEVVPIIERLAKRVDEIARTPLPPLTMAKGTVSVSKQQDRGNSVGSGDPELSPDAIAAALSKMSKEEQTLTLIKASYATPIRIPGSAAGHT